MQKNIQPSLTTIVTSAMSFRLIVDTTAQFITPYLPIFAAGLNLSIIEIGWIISIRSLIGLLSPLLGIAAERQGYRTLMRLGLISSAAGLFTFAMSSGLFGAAAGMLLMGIGSAAFVPTLFAWASALMPFDQRSKGLGSIELSWALAGMVGVPITGFAIVRFGWRPPLFVLSGLLLLSAFVIGRLPGRSDRDHQDAQKANLKNSSAQLRDMFDLGINRRSAWVVIIGGALITFANLHTFSVYAQWLVDQFDVKDADLVWVALLLGGADLISNLGISFFGDRIGPLRGIKIGLLGAMACFVLLFLLQTAGFWLFLVGLFVARYFMENVFVNNIILTSEQTPDFRTKSLTLSAAAGTIGGAAANWLGPVAYTRLGPSGLIFPSAIAFFAVWLLLHLFAKEKGETVSQAGG